MPPAYVAARDKAGILRTYHFAIPTQISHHSDHYNNPSDHTEQDTHQPPSTIHATMASSPAGSSDLSSPPSEDYEHDQEQDHDDVSTIEPSSRRSADVAQLDPDHLAPPPKRRKTGPPNPSLLGYDRAPSSQPDGQDDDVISLSSDGWSEAPGSPSHDEYAVREDAQTECQWRDCSWGPAENNDELVNHVQNVHCATGGPKKTKYVCEWGECQRKQSNHPSGYALKAHMRSHTKEKPYYCSLPGKLETSNEHDHKNQVRSQADSCNRMRQVVHTLRRSGQTHAHRSRA